MNLSHKRPRRRTNKTFATNHINKMFDPVTPRTANDYRLLSQQLALAPPLTLARSELERGVGVDQ